MSESTSLVAIDETEFLNYAAETMRADGESLVIIDTRRFETADDMFTACRNVFGIAQAAVEVASRRAIVANTSIGRGLVWGYTAVCDFAGVAANKRTPINKLTAGAVAKVLGINEANCASLVGVSWGQLNACVELGRADDHDHREAELLLADRNKSVTVKSLREACNEVLNPDVFSNRKVGADKARAAALAAVKGNKLAAIAASGADSKTVATITNKVAASLLTPAAINAASDDQLSATMWAIRQVQAARKAGTLSAPKSTKRGNVVTLNKAGQANVSAANKRKPRKVAATA